MINIESKAELIQKDEMKPSLNELKMQWSLLTSPKIKMFLWKAFSEVLPVVDLITRRGMSVDSRCHIYGEEGESINHVLFFCSLARQVWAVSSFPSPPGGFDRCAIYSNFSYLLASAVNRVILKELRNLFPWLL